MLFIKHCAGLLFKPFGNGIPRVFIQHAKPVRYARARGSPVEPVEKQLRRGVRLRNVAVHQVVIILVEQIAQRAPVAPVKERRFAGIEHARLIELCKLLVNAAHHMHIGKIVKLKVFAYMELVLQPFRLHMRHKISHLGLAGRRQRLKQNHLEYVVFHAVSFFLYQ